MEQEAHQESQQIAALEQALRDAAEASNFFETDMGRIFVSLATAEITRLTREITSDKFKNDHSAYVNALCELQCWQRHLRKLQLTANPARSAKLREQLDQMKDEQ